MDYALKGRRPRYRRQQEHPAGAIAKGLAQEGVNLVMLARTKDVARPMQRGAGGKGDAPRSAISRRTGAQKCRPAPGLDYV